MTKEERIEYFREKIGEGVWVTCLGRGQRVESFQPTIRFEVSLGVEAQMDAKALGEEGTQILKDAIFEEIMNSCTVKLPE